MMLKHETIKKIPHLNIKIRNSSTEQYNLKISVGLCITTETKIDKIAPVSVQA